MNQDVTPQGMPVVAGDSTVWARKLTSGAVAVALCALRLSAWPLRSPV